MDIGFEPSLNPPEDDYCYCRDDGDMMCDPCKERDADEGLPRCVADWCGEYVDDEGDYCERCEHLGVV